MLKKSHYTIYMYVVMATIVQIQSEKMRCIFNITISWYVSLMIFPCNRFFLKQKEDPETQWKLPDNFEVVYSQVQGEIMVGGVFLRIFISQPTWVSVQ